MKFVIFGTGGTGGVTGTYLAKAGEEVTFIARGQHLAAMRQNGLTLKTAHRGDIVLKPVDCCPAEEYSGKPDVMFICVKYYALPDAIAFARRAATADTLIIPILNVFGTGEIMQADLPGLTVLDGCIYVFAKIAAPGVIEQPQSILRMFYGFRPGQGKQLEPKARELERILQGAGIRGHYSENILRDALQKFGFVSPMGAAGLYLGITSEGFQQPGEARDMFVGLIREVEAIGHGMGISFDRDLVETGLKMIDAFKPGLTTSLQRDVAQGGASEFDGLVNRIVRLGERYQVPVPLYKKISDWGKGKGIK